MAFLLALASILLAIGCATPSPPPTASGDAPARSETAYILAGGWHTEIGLPAGAITGPLSALKEDFTTAQILVFGWGARDFYMAPEPDLGDLLRAMWPGPAVTLVRPLAELPATRSGNGTRVLTLRLSHEELERLALYIWSSLAKDDRGAPRRIGAGLTPGSAFYASPTTYDLNRTCNTWTAQALQTAGLPVRADGVVFAGQVLDQVRPLAAASTAD